MFAEFALMIVLAAQRPQPTVTVVEGRRETAVRIVDARREYRRLRAVKPLAPRQQARLTALVIALGTLPDPNPTVCIGSRCEVFRGRRIAAQAQPE